VAHPDDEVLWASSLVGRIKSIVICFEEVASNPDCGEGRRRSLAAFPCKGVSQLAMREAEVFDTANWSDPEETAYGLRVRRRPGAMPGFSERRYQENYARLVQALRPLLQGCGCVVTHSPWGEYGHEEHVQVFRAVAHLQHELGFDLWVPGYVSTKSYPLMLRHIPRLAPHRCCLATDPELARRIQEIYMANGCWTWFRDYVWPAQDVFFRWTGPDLCPAGSVPLRQGSCFELLMNVIELGNSSPPPLWKRVARRAHRLLRPCLPQGGGRSD
jgi:LmbE family N-acetylglucosaminyl deacetylase